MFHISIDWQQTDSRTAAWTENWWNDADTLVDALGRGETLAERLYDLHGKTTDYTYIRAQRVPGNDGLAVEKEVDGTNYVFKGNPRSGAGVSDLAPMAIWLRLASGKKTTYQWIKGVRDEFCADGGLLQKELPSYKTAISKLEKHLKENGFQIRKLDTAQKKKIVKSITEAGIVTVTGHNYPDGSFVRLSGLKFNKYPQDIWGISRLIPDDANKFELNHFAPPDPWVPPGGNITARLQVYKYYPIEFASGIRSTTRKVGRPKRVYSGKSTTRS